MNKLKYVFGAAMFSAALVLGLTLTKTVSATPQNEDNVTICHRTHSATNPYVRITVDPDAADGNTGNDNGKGDHSTHTGPVATSVLVAKAYKAAGTQWGDIIPPHDNFLGLNWNSDGMAVFENGCLGGEEITEVVPAAVTFTAPTCDVLGTYTIPSTEHVTYKINGQVVAAGTYTAQNGTTVTVTAEADEGFFIGDESTDTWTNTFTAPTNCGHVLAEQVTVKPAGAVNAGAGGASAFDLGSL